MKTQDDKSRKLTAAKEHVRARSEAKTLAKDVMEMIWPMIESKIEKRIEQAVEKVEKDLMFRDTTLVSAKELEDVLGSSYDTIRKMDKSHWPQVHLNPGGTRYIKELVVAAIAQQ